MASNLTKAAGAAGHTSGIFADMTLDGPEIGTLVVVVDRAKNLPNRKTMGKQDPYCAMRLGKEAKKTDTDRRGGQTPRWDQELRFTVHDSPDYYKLKVSIFNDDKRTDLIGEAFVSLVDLIKPGGGSNDLWHQLSYKGKYAGDVRIEMTYYDMRPREEKAVEKRRHREKTVSSFGETSASPSGLSGPRQLGPREVRRRPLPSSPGQVPQTQQQMYSQPTPVAHHQQHSSADQHAHHYHSTAYVTEDFDAQPAYHEMKYQNHDAAEPSLPALQPMTPEQFRSGAGVTAEPMDPTLQSQRRRSYLPPDNIPADFNVCDSSEAPVNHHGGQNASYRESPLAYPVHSYVEEEEEMELEPPPPPPPKHHSSPRNTIAEHPSPSYPSMPVRPIPIRPTIEERSPLQNIEHHFNPNVHDSTETFAAGHVSESLQPIGRRTSYGIQTEESVSIAPQQNAQARQPAPTSYRQGAVDQRERRNSFNPHQHNLPERQMPPLPNRPRSYDEQLPHYGHAEIYNSSPHAQSMPVLPQLSDDSNRARPQKRSSGQVPARKAVSPNPYLEDTGSRYPDEAGGRRLSGVPFGPAAYDVLNPAANEVTNESTAFETPEQARHSARLRESRVAEDLVPIVDNDGRVIDPSDHLPTSSWAPEPERKQRKPEHVIHYRTKNDGRGQTTPTSSPASVRMRTRNSHPVTPATSSPVSAPPSSGRAHTHRPMSSSIRPLPAQPFQQPYSEPDRIADSYNHHTQHRTSYHENTSGIQRPQLSEYQVPISSNYAPRGPIHPQNPHRLSMSSGGYSHNFHDPLAAEMSMIDIGPSRGGRRMGRGY